LVRDRFPYGVSKISIVHGRVAIRSEIEPINLTERLFEPFLEIKSCVV